MRVHHVLHQRDEVLRHQVGTPGLRQQSHQLGGVVMAVCDQSVTRFPELRIEKPNGVFLFTWQLFFTLGA